MAPAVLVLLLSVGTFQAVIPGLADGTSPSFPDTAQGLKDFTAWAKTTLPPPRFNQPPLNICVVGATHFTPEKAPYLPKPLWESQWPVRALEPYSATFHYVDEAPAGASAKPRTLKQAVALCTAKPPRKPPAKDRP